MMDGPDGELRRTALIQNRRGLHARAAAKFVKLASQYDAEVTVAKKGMEVSGRSIMGLMMLAAGPGCTIATVRLGKWLEEPAAVLKLNIEGAECAVIEESESRLRSVEKIFIEYHGFPELPQTLHRILAALDRAGFRYCLGAMDRETNPVCHAPFNLGQRRFFNLVYAERQERT